MADPALERVHAASAAWVFLPASAARLETEDFLLVRYPDYFDRPVQVVRMHAGRPPGEVLDEIVAQARHLVDPSVPATAHLACWVRLDAPEGLEDALRQRGAALDETVEVLALDLTGVDAAAIADATAPVGDLEVRWTDDFDVLVDASRLGTEVFGGAPADRDTLAGVFDAERAKYLGGGGGAVVAYLDGRPVGSGGLTMAGTDARLWSGAVLPDVRGRGIYRTMLAARLAYAVARGAELALVKGRVATSGPILRRCGFAGYGEERSYLIPLS